MNIHKCCVFTHVDGCTQQCPLFINRSVENISMTHWHGITIHWSVQLYWAWTGFRLLLNVITHFTFFVCNKIKIKMLLNMHLLLHFTQISEPKRITLQYNIFYNLNTKIHHNTKLSKIVASHPDFYVQFKHKYWF